MALTVLSCMCSTGLKGDTSMNLYSSRSGTFGEPLTPSQNGYNGLGLTEEDMEWFLGLDATGPITVRTPYYQQKQMKPSNGHQVLSGEKMLQSHKNSFRPDRGIGQGYTPSTLIFIAVFNIFCSLYWKVAVRAMRTHMQMIWHTWPRH